MDRVLGLEGSSFVVVLIISFKVWLFAFASWALLADLLFFSWLPLSTVGVGVILAVLFKFRLPAADVEDVVGFFGKGLRPLQEHSSPDNSSSSAPEVLTVKSRLAMMKSASSSAQSAVQDSDVPLVVIAHRAAGLDAPENSLSAIRECKKRGCLAVEFDVSVTKDKVPVLFHDDNLIRVAGIDRDICDMTYAELSQVDISKLHPLGEKFKKERVPKLEDAVNLCLSLGIKFIVDIKDDDENLVQYLVKMFRERSAYSMGVVSSFNPKIIYELRRQERRIIGCMAWRPGYYRFSGWNGSWNDLQPRHRPIYQQWLDITMDCANNWLVRNFYWWFIGLSAYLFNKDSISREESYRWTQKGLRLFLWTVNEPLEKLHFVQNVQLGYLTDTLDSGEISTISELHTSGCSS